MKDYSKVSERNKLYIGIIVLIFVFCGLCFYREYSRKVVLENYEKNPDAYFDLREKVIGIDDKQHVVCIYDSSVHFFSLNEIHVDADINDLEELKGMYLYRDSKNDRLPPVVRKE